MEIISNYKFIYNVRWEGRSFVSVCQQIWHKYFLELNIFHPKNAPLLRCKNWQKKWDWWGEVNEFLKSCLAICCEQFSIFMSCLVNGLGKCRLTKNIKSDKEASDRLSWHLAFIHSTITRLKIFYLKLSRIWSFSVAWCCLELTRFMGANV